MKNLKLFPFAILIFIILWGFQSCKKGIDILEEKIASSRGIETIADITVPNGNHNIYLGPERPESDGHCDCPNGWCGNYSAVNFSSGKGRKATLSILDKETIRISFLEANAVDWLLLELQVTKDFGKERAIEIMDSYRNEFRIATEVEVVAESSKKILAAYDLTGLITLIPGKYSIIKDKENRYGYMDVSVKIR